MDSHAVRWRSNTQQLSRRLGNSIYLKREDLQPIFSFKCRGAYNRMFQLSPEERGRGVCCVSAGNHAQGVALAARALNLRATIYMPSFAPRIKVDAVKQLGANVVLVEGDFDEAKKLCLTACQERSWTFIPPFDDPYVIAGQGVVGVEILRQIKQTRLDAIFVCCGGGGLLAGVAAFVKRIRPEVRVVGVNTADSNSMFQSLHAGTPVELRQAGLFSDGTAVRRVGQECLRLCQYYVDDMVADVTNDEICAAIKDGFEDTRSILEPSGALALAGCKKYLASNPDIRDGVFAVVTSGANMNFNRLRFVAERSELGEGRECLISVLVHDRPGSLRELYRIIHPHNLTELSYRYNEAQGHAGRNHIYTAFEVVNGEDASGVISALEAKGMEVLNLSDNEMAKAHARYMIGGRSFHVRDEVLYRFRFPERPGSIKRFMDMLEETPHPWNISLFHYRNHGADFGRVLVGLMVPMETREAFATFLASVMTAGFCECVEETQNPVYAHFLH
jgi:threonine dehydratase